MNLNSSEQALQVLKMHPTKYLNFIYSLNYWYNSFQGGGTVLTPLSKLSGLFLLRGIKCPLPCPQILPSINVKWSHNNPINILSTDHKTSHASDWLTNYDSHLSWNCSCSLNIKNNYFTLYFCEKAHRGFNNIFVSSHQKGQVGWHSISFALLPDCKSVTVLSKS